MYYTPVYIGNTIPACSKFSIARPNLWSASSSMWFNNVSGHTYQLTTGQLTISAIIDAAVTGQ